MVQQVAVSGDVSAELMVRLRRLVSDYQGYGVSTVLVWWALGRIRKAMGPAGNSISGREFVLALRQLEAAGKVTAVRLEGSKPTFEITDVWRPRSGPFWGSPVLASPVKHSSSGPQSSSRASSASDQRSRLYREEDLYSSTYVNSW